MQIQTTRETKKVALRYPLLALVAIGALAGVAAITSAVSALDPANNMVQNAYAMRMDDSYCYLGPLEPGGDVYFECWGPSTPGP